ADRTLALDHMFGVRGEEVPLDRHQDFVSTVSLAADRFSVNRRDHWSSGLWSEQSTELSNATSLQDSTLLGVTRLPDLSANRTHRFTSATTRTSTTARSLLPSSSRVSLHSKRSGRKAGAWGVRIREDTLPRQDPVPVRLSGRRHVAAPDEKVQVWVRVPKGKLAFWVPPNLRLGPPEAAGESCEAPGRLTPFRSLLTHGKAEPLDFAGSAVSLVPNAQEHVQSTAKLSEITSQMSPCPSSSFLNHGAENSFKGLIEAATGIPVAQQKLFYGPTGLLEDNSKALYQYEIGQGCMVHLTTRRDPEKVAKFHQDRKGRRKSQKEAGIENPQHLLDGRIFDRIRKFMKTKVGSKMGKDLVMIVPDWQKAGVVPLEYEWPHEQPWHDYGATMTDNGIFDFAGRIRKKFHRLPRLAKAAASPKLTEAHAAHAAELQCTGVISG
ncbi:unnamed protein product, partial [Effrenium voratum]